MPSQEVFKRRELKDISDIINASGVENILSHSEFSYIQEYIKNNNISKIVLNTTLLTSKEQSMDYRFDDNTLVIFPYFKKNGTDNANIIIYKDKINTNFIDNSVVTYFQDKGIKKIIINLIHQLKIIDKVLNKITLDEAKKDEENSFLMEYGIKIK